MEEILQQIAAGEDTHTEFKTSLASWRKIVETVAGMATVGGGTILVGVRPDGTPCGVDLGEGSQEQLIQRVLDSTDPRIYVELDRPTVAGERLLRIVVPAGDGPHLALGRAFHRPGPATVQMSRAEYERRLLDRVRESSGFERRPATDCALEEIDPEATTWFTKRAAPRGRAPETPGEVLSHLKLLTDGAPRVGAMLLFGREPQAAFPQAVVRGRAARGASSDVLSAEGNLFRQIDAAVHFVQRNLRTRVMIREVRRDELPELPTVAVREAITNAVVHRDYRSTAPTQLRLDDRALEIWNPGHLPEPITPALLREDHPSVPTNPLMARAMHRAGYIEEWGSGTLRIIDALRDAGHPEPSFSQARGGVLVVLPLVGAVPTDLNRRQTAWLKAQAAGTTFATRDYATCFSVTARTAQADLRALAERGLVSPRGAGAARHWVRC